MTKGAPKLVANNRTLLQWAMDPPATPNHLPVPVPEARTYIVFGAKGGCGATTLAVNLAAHLARNTMRGSLVIDMDFQLGDVLCALNLSPRATLADLVTSPEALDSASLRRAMAPHASGTFVLSQAGCVEQLDSLPPERIGEFLGSLTAHFDTIIIDGLRDFCDLSIAALDRATKVILVISQDIPAVRSAARCLELFRRLGYPRDKIMVVINRFQRHADIDCGLIERALGLPITATVRNDFPTVCGALNRGLTVADHAPRSEPARDIEILAERLRPTAATAGPARRNRIRRWFGKGAKP